MGLQENLEQVHIKPLQMSKEDRLREAEMLMNATSDDMKSMFSQVIGCVTHHLSFDCLRDPMM
jgi:hypothetical protein